MSAAAAVLLLDLAAVAIAFQGTASFCGGTTMHPQVNSCVPEESLQFTAFRTTVLSGSDLVWEFGDGTAPVRGNPVCHAYRQPGVYEVLARVESTDTPIEVTTVVKVDVFQPSYELARGYIELIPNAITVAVGETKEVLARIHYPAGRISTQCGRDGARMCGPAHCAEISVSGQFPRDATPGMYWPVKITGRSAGIRMMIASDGTIGKPRVYPIGLVRVMDPPPRRRGVRR